MNSIIKQDLNEQVRLGKLEVKTGTELLEVVKSFSEGIEKSVYDDLDETEKENFSKSVEGFFPVDVISVENDSLNKSIVHETLYIREIKEDKLED